MEPIERMISRCLEALKLLRIVSSSFNLVGRRWWRMAPELSYLAPLTDGIRTDRDHSP